MRLDILDMDNIEVRPPATHEPARIGEAALSLPGLTPANVIKPQSDRHGQHLTPHPTQNTRL